VTEIIGNPSSSRRRKRQFPAFLALILAAGNIYFLPYLRQSYNNTMLEVLGISSTELGFINSVFGAVAMAMYLPSGWIADRFSPRKLLTGSLLCTGLSGLYYATFPPYWAVLGIHALWGVCTILTFWSALIKAIRALGRSEDQGRTFGLLEGGRGATEAAIAALALVAFASMGEGASGLAAAIIVYSVMALVAAGAVWFLIPDSPPERPSQRAKARRGGGLGTFARIAKMPVAWLLAGVVLSAYGAYWGTFNLSAFAEDCFGVGAASSAKLSTFRMWFRALAPVVAGFLADRFSPSRVVSVGFFIVAASFATFALMPCEAAYLWLLWLNTAVVALAVFALRGIYFALLQEGQIPLAVTGSVVGAVSLLGYTPDLWAPLLSGWLIDGYPGAEGHRYYFVFLAGLSLVGLTCATLLGRRSRRVAVTSAGQKNS
jgi:sugar phosphate permease